MRIDYNQKTQFYGIYVKKGGEEFVKNEGGENALSKLHFAKERFKSSRWNLFIDDEGYTLEASNKKKYKGPFSVKRIFKTGGARQDTTKLVIRMDKANRVRYPIFIPTRADLTKWYRQIKSEKGLDKMINILTVLERAFK